MDPKLRQDGPKMVPDPFGTLLGPFWDPSGTLLGPFWDPFKRAAALFGTERGGPFKKKTQRSRKNGLIAKKRTAPRREAHFQEGRPVFLLRNA